MYVKGQPAMRMAARYDEAALAVLAGDGALFPRHPDPARTGLLARPPGYALFLSTVYRLAGRSFFEVQLLQNLLDAAGVLPLIVLGTLLGGEGVGLLAGLLYAVSPHLAVGSNLLTPDSLCPAVLLLGLLPLVGVPPGKAGIPRLVLAGLVLGAAAWLRPNWVLVGPALVPAILLVWRVPFPRAALAGIVPLVAALVVLPITLRNYVVFHAFVPISINGGLTLWEAIADAGGQKYGARRGDKQVIEEEASRHHNPRYAEWWAEPDGIERDRERARRSLEIIRAHPFWWARAMARRMAGMLDYWTSPPPLVGRGEPLLLPEEQDPGGERESGFSERAEGAPPPLLEDASCLAPGRAASVLRIPVRILQEILRVVVLPGVLLGVWVFARRDPGHAALLGTVPLYCLLTEAWALVEWRVVAAMHPCLFVFAGFGFAVLAGWPARLRARGGAPPPRDP
jgi:hypothetical protein